MGAENKGRAEGLKAIIALRNAKNAPMPYINGGSPTAFDFNSARFSELSSRKCS